MLNITIFKKKLTSFTLFHINQCEIKPYDFIIRLKLIDINTWDFSFSGGLTALLRVHSSRDHKQVTTI